MYSILPITEPLDEVREIINYDLEFFWLVGIVENRCVIPELNKYLLN